MSEWDEAKKYLIYYAKDDAIIKRRDIRNQLKDAVKAGDKLQNLNHRLAQSAIVYEQKVMIANQKLQDAESWTEKGFVVINKEKLDEHKEETEGYKARYDDLHRITVKWQKKLEAICDYMNQLHVFHNDPQMVEYVHSPTIVKKVRELLGDE